MCNRRAYDRAKRHNVAICVCAATVQQPEQITCNVRKSVDAEICWFAGTLKPAESSCKPSRFLDAEEVSGSNPLSPTRLKPP